MKKIILAVIFSLIIVIVNINAFATPSLKVMVSSSTGSVGEDVCVLVSISENSGICGGKFNLNYDNDVLELKSVAIGDVLSGYSAIVNDKYSENTIKATWAGIENTNESGTMLTVIFTIRNTMQYQTSITLSECKFTDADGASVNFETLDGTVTVLSNNKSATNHTSRNSSSKLSNMPKDTLDKQDKTGDSHKTFLLGFSDVSKTDWFYEPVCFVYENKLMQGVSNIEFAPNMPVTRAMFVTVLYRMEGEPEVANNNVFTDVKSGEYYEKAVIWAQGNEIVKGISDNEFAPNANITREQMAAIIYRYANFKGIDTESVMENTNTLSHNDIFKVSDWAKEAMNYCIAAGIITGDNDGNLNPQNNATRAEFATILMRTADIIK